MTIVNKLFTFHTYDKTALDKPRNTYKGVEEDELESFIQAAEGADLIWEAVETGYIDRREGRCHYVWTKPNASPWGEGQDNWSTVDPYSNY